MGRHSRSTADATAPPPRGHRGARRSGPAARTGLLGASAAMAVGAVAVVTGVLPTPGGLAHGGYQYGDTGPGGNLARADGTPSALATDGDSTLPGAGAAGGTAASPSAGPARTKAGPSAPVTRKPSPAPTATRSAAALRVTAPAPGATVSAQAAEVLTLVNQQRAQAGCRPLTMNTKLTELAQNYSEEMAARGFFDHTDPDGKTPWNRAAALGISNLGGENIAMGQPDAQSVMTAWMNSPGHRANILDCDYHTIGIGIGLHYAAGGESGGPWWTQDFGF